MAINSTVPTDDVGKAYTDMLTLYYDVVAMNKLCSYGDASNLLRAVQQLLLQYNEQCMAYLEDETEDKSLIGHISSDGLEQWEFYKSFYNRYNVQLF